MKHFIISADDIKEIHKLSMPLSKSREHTEAYKKLLHRLTKIEIAEGIDYIKGSGYNSEGKLIRTEIYLVDKEEL